MTSRLDRLFILLESGSSAVTRRAAAKQIGEVQKLHPHELHNLLNRLIVYLHSSSWDTRIAAAQTVEAILENVPKWDPKPCLIKNECSNDGSNDDSEKGQLRFSNFDLASVLEKGARLMGSEGTEFDFQDDVESDSKEHLMKQRTLLNEKLGLAQANRLGITLEDIVTLDDMKTEKMDIKNECSKPRLMPVQEILNLSTNKNNITDSATSSHCSLSCREKNRARRKARQSNQTYTSQLSRSNSINNGGSSSTTTMMDITEPERKKVKLEHKQSDDMEITPSATNLNIISSGNEPVPDDSGSWGSDATTWPLESFCSKLYIDLFNAKWETRHGAATALRELLKSHCDGAGKSTYMMADEMIHQHQLWLEDAALRLLCVLSLDRFGDFVSDQVIAPVRETCAQVLGTALKQMPTEKVEGTIEILLKLIKQNDWEVRHGGLLGIKYLLVVREDLLQIFLPQIINHILTGLFDNVDDVGAVAASTLIPIANWLPKLLSFDDVSNIVKMLWDLLLDQDELTSACNSFMGLLAAILSLPNASKWIQMEPMSILVPRLWPFLSHSTSSVRRSTLQTLKTLTQSSIILNDNIENNSQLSSTSTSLENINNKQNTNEASKMLSLVINNELNNKIMNVDLNTLNLNFGVKEWPPQLLQEALRHIYQRVLVEHIEDIQSLVEEVWCNLVTNAELSALLHAACPYVASWLCLAMQPARLAFDPTSLIYAKPIVLNRERRNRNLDLDVGNVSFSQQKLYLGGTETTPIEIREKNVTRARYRATKMLGLLSQYLVLPAPGVLYTTDVESPIDCYSKVLLGHLQSRSALQRLISGMVISFWALKDHSIRPGPPAIQTKLKYCLMENVYYDEVAIFFTRLLQDARDFLATLKQYNIHISELENCKILTLEQILQLSTSMTENLKQRYNLRPKIASLLDERRKGLQNSYSQTSFEQNSFNISTQAALAGATVSLHCLPEKLNPVIKPLMESIKREECEILQLLSAQYLVNLLNQISDRNPCPNSKIVTNLCTLLKSDVDFTPKITIPETDFSSYSNERSDINNPFYGILALTNQQKALINQNGSTPRGPGRPPANIDVSLEELSEIEDPSKKQNRIQRIGATFAITVICSEFGSDMPIKIPRLWELMTNYITTQIDENSVDKLLKEKLNEEQTNELVTSLQLIEISVPHVDRSLDDKLFILLPKLCILLRHPLKAIRHLTARCLATFATINATKVMDIIIEKVIPLLGDIENIINRQGAAETIACIVNKLQFKIVPYVVLLIVPILGRMSDPDQMVRLMSTHCFATLIQLMPLDGCTPDLPILSEELKNRKMKDKEFLEYLFTPKTIPDFKVPVEIKAELRSYQQAGVNWLWFLNKYKLHGILCDDMGLGKTLQTICILAGDHHQRIMENLSQIPSLVICPPTLTGHWVYEVNKFLPNKFLKPVHYVGLPADRERLRSKLGSYNLVVASYDIVRKDIEFFSRVKWNYCVLDEGHVIKNGKTKCSKAIKQLIANHRLILSGTPIQNNVLELWSLFDFLMPGFLGTERQFITRFSRPILASRDARSSPKEQEAGALAMEALHRQVLPFLLRRVKQDVLTDLPPKITQDLLCELSPLQERLYEDFSKTHLKADLRDCIQNISGQAVHKKTHVFQALRYLQNVCNHPKLVLNTHHPEYTNIQSELAKVNSSLNDIEHSAKLPALKQLLLDCGIGNEDVSINQHRALIFCQLKAMLDIIENDLLKKHLPAVSYLRLDGSIPPSSRHEIVTKFNNDPSIDVLLLTTQVGGLGLNLTGADTVIFVEHDWNPMKDLQAMDRAHRIGQKKVVNVYRLITRKSLEEKIMCLQKFKLMTANTVVSDENASMETMGTDQLLDLFDLSDKNKSTVTTVGNSASGSVSMKQVLETLPELWEDKQYEEEYDMTQFLDGLKK